jgi:hypothetical protein
MSLFAEPKRSGKRKEANMDPETRRVKGKRPIDAWDARDYKDAGVYLERHSRIDGQCRVWCGGKNTGLRRAYFRGVVMPAHRMAYYQRNQGVRFQEDAQVHQTCGNKLCIKGEHLELAVAKQNEEQNKSSHEWWLPVDLTPGVAQLPKSDDGFHSLEAWSAMDPDLVAHCLQQPPKKQRV